MIRYVCFCITLLIITSLCSCDVHQFPELKKPDIEPPNHITLRLHYEPDFWVWKHLYDPKQSDYPVEMYPDSDFDPNHPGTTSVYDNTMQSGMMDIRVKIYNSGNMSDCVAEFSFMRDVSEGYDCDLDIELNGGKYDIIVWSHLLETADSEPFYEASNFRAISIIDENYIGNTDYRDAFCGRRNFEISDEPTSSDEQIYEIEMQRPMGKLEFETIDLSEFLDRETVRRNLSSRASIEDYNVMISYTYYYPNGYNAIYDDILSGGGYRFATQMTITGESEASMGFDYVLINNIPDGRVQAQVSVFDLSGSLVANSQTIMIPIRRDYHTILRGAFLSMNANGGVGLDPDYDGDYNVFH